MILFLLLAEDHEQDGGNADAEGFLAALNAAYPELPGDAAALANALYANK